MDREACAKRRERGVMDGAGDAYDDIKERLAFYVEWYVLDDDRRGYNLVVLALAGRARGVDGRCEDVRHRGRASGGREVRVVVRGQGSVVGDWDGVLEPLLT